MEWLPRGCPAQRLSDPLQLSDARRLRLGQTKVMLALYRDLKGSLKGDKDIDVEVEVGVDIDWYFGCLKEASKSIQVLLNGIDAVMVLTLIILKWEFPRTRDMYYRPHVVGFLFQEHRTKDPQINGNILVKTPLSRG